MFEEYQKQEEIKVFKALEVIKQYCNFYQNQNKSCKSCMLHHEKENRCSLNENHKTPKDWDINIKVEI